MLLSMSIVGGGERKRGKEREEERGREGKREAKGNGKCISRREKVKIAVKTSAEKQLI